MLTINPTLVSTIVGLLLPLLSALLIRSEFSARTKVTINLVLSAVLALIISATTDTGAAVFSWQTLFDWALQTTISVLSYVGLYKRFDINAKVPTLPGVPAAASAPTSEAEAEVV